jgi:hypothetical protein
MTAPVTSGSEQSRRVFVHDLCTDFSEVGATTGGYQQLKSRQTKGVDDSGRVTGKGLQFPKSGASANSATFARAGSLV